MNDHRAPVTAARINVDVRSSAPSGVACVAAEVFYSSSPPTRTPTPVVVCLPGGGISRGYFDLHVGNDASYSLARYLAANGYIVVTVDPPGVGESDRPDDGYALTPPVVADVCDVAANAILDRLRAGALCADLAACADVVPVGLGYSAGALLTVVEQARHRTYDALVLVGFHGRGLPEYLPENVRPYADDPAALNDHLAALTESFFGEPLPMGSGGDPSLLVHGDVPPAFLEAWRGVQAPLLGLVGLASLVPGSVSDALGVIDVPVFVGVGEHDIACRAREMPVELSASRDVTVFELPGAGHEQMIAGNRIVLLERIAAWIESLRATCSVGVAS